MEREKKNKATQPRSRHTQIMFVKEGETPTSASLQRTSRILCQAGDWKLAVELNQRLTFPDIVPTNLRPDMVLWLSTTRMVIIIELTVPWVERCSEALERKRGKYEALLMECREKGWQTCSFPVEVGCRGFPHSLCGEC
ncbi:uncharacterized protein LOC132558232 [Ylistrum balloti]|uniref:uncharacterized protein LOC132558232 n=1 Tax=Ylistrum balloti TaxID=509963 RepID=UPI0029059960|nr:uncharacterized protein LOC132558232 [Ylistrum balloti]